MSDPVTVSPLRQRMIEDMTIRRFGEHTQPGYARQVREFTAFLGLPPARAEPDDLRRYQLHMPSLGASYARMNLACTALRFCPTAGFVDTEIGCFMNRDVGYAAQTVRG